MIRSRRGQPFHDIDDVAIHVMRVEAVDSDRSVLLPQSMSLQRRDDVLAGLLLVVGGDGVLEVEEMMSAADLAAFSNIQDWSPEPRVRSDAGAALLAR